jgi:hypothetical protein
MAISKIKPNNLFNTHKKDNLDWIKNFQNKNNKTPSTTKSVVDNSVRIYYFTLYSTFVGGVIGLVPHFYILFFEILNSFFGC